MISSRMEEVDELTLPFMEATPAKAKVRVLMVPLPTQSHLNQLLHLGRLIADRGIPVHYAAPAAQNRQARLRAHGWSEDDHVHQGGLFHFHDLSFPTDIPSPPPDPNEPNKFPAHLQPLFDAAEPHLRCPLAGLIRSLAAVTDHLAVVHDVLMSFVAAEVALFSNSKAYAFGGGGVFNAFKDQDVDALTDEQRQEIAPLIVHSGFSLTGCYSDEFLSLIYHQKEYLLQFVSGVIYNSHRSIEGKYIPLLVNLKNKQVWLVGPLNLPNNKADQAHKQHPCIAWLDKQPPASVIYVSFGTMTSISGEQVDEIATGLKCSGHRFLWVLREADRSDIFGDEERCYKIGEEYEEEVKEMGIVVRDWVPQLEILGHEAVGGFMSHCGWNSCMESLSMGKPVAAWPTASDQPKNAVLLTEALKVGLMVRDWAQWAEVVRAHEISIAVKRLLGSEEGNDLRKKAHEVGVELRLAHNEGGVSRAELDSLLACFFS